MLRAADNPSLDEAGRIEPLVRLDQVVSPVLRMVSALWKKERDRGALPSTANIDHEALKAALDRLIIFEVIDGGKRFRYRVIGRTCAERVGVNLTGKFLEDHPKPRFAAAATSALREVVRTRIPHVFSALRAIDQSLWAYQAVLLPCADGGDDVTRVLVGQEFEPGAPRSDRLATVPAPQPERRLTA